MNQVNSSKGSILFATENIKNICNKIDDQYLGAVEMEMSFKNFLRAGNIAQSPFLCTTLFGIPRIIRTIGLK
jgi:hypothetical protein